MVVQSDVFAVVADPTRRHLIETLYGAEQSVQDLVKAVGIAQPGVSRHLRILNEAGMVTCRPDGQRRFYSLRPGSLRGLDHWVRRYVQDNSERLDRLASIIPKQEKQ